MKRFLSVALASALAAIPSVGVAADGRYIVQFNPGRSQAALGALHAAGARVVLPLGPQNAVAAVIPEQAIAGLSRNPNIEYIEEDAIRVPMAADRVLGTGEVLPYGVQMVQADLVSSTNEAGPKICIIDSGYSQQQEDLRDAGASITQQASDSGSGAWDKDSCGHGTHVAGTVMATAGNSLGVIGVVPGVRLHVVKVFGDNDLVEGGTCTWTYSSRLIDALNSCQGAGSNITSMSLGGGAKSRTEQKAFDAAYEAGMLHVAAAGNDGNRRTSFPAGYASVISVAAVDSSEVVADFSQQNRDVELAAPGVGVLSTVPWLDTNSLAFAGTSVSGGHIEFSARTTGVSGPLANGGLCDSIGAWSGKVVLCQRGTVSFNDKVQNVQAGGGVAAVIYNNIASDATCGDFAGTLGDGASSSIPGISVSCADGAQAVGSVGSNGTVASSFTAPESGYEAWNGTSMATPHVSGVAALVWGCHPTASNLAIRNALNATAKDKGAAGRDTSYGYGIVQARDAVASLGSSAFCTTLAGSKY
jgi:subtilisin family serine protease